MLMQREEIMSQIVDPNMLNHLYEVRSICGEKCKLIMMKWFSCLRLPGVRWSFRNAINCTSGCRVCRPSLKTSVSNQFKKSRETPWIMPLRWRRRVLPQTRPGRLPNWRRTSKRLARSVKCLLLYLGPSYLSRISRKTSRRPSRLNSSQTLPPICVSVAPRPNSSSSKAGSMSVKSAFWTRSTRTSHTKTFIWRCSTRCKTSCGSGWSNCRATRPTFQIASPLNSSLLLLLLSLLPSLPPPPNRTLRMRRLLHLLKSLRSAPAAGWLL